MNVKHLLRRTRNALTQPISYTAQVFETKTQVLKEVPEVLTDVNNQVNLLLDCGEAGFHGAFKNGFHDHCAQLIQQGFDDAAVQEPSDECVPDHVGHAFPE